MKRYAVIFKTIRDLPISDEYLEINKRMFELVKECGGFLGVDSAMDSTGKGISISYWNDLDEIANWRKNIEHLNAQSLGKKKWYKYFKVEICEIYYEYNGGMDFENASNFSY